MVINMGKGTILILCFTGMFLSHSLSSIQAPLLPKEAAEKNISSCGYCLVFVFFEVSALLLLFSLTKSLLSNHIHCLLCIASMILGISSILFGSLTFVYNIYAFVILAAFLGFLQGTGFTLITACSNILLNNVLCLRDIEMLVFLELSTTVGMVCGPILAGLLYGIRGFFFPFCGIGIVMVLCSVISYWAMPHDYQHLSEYKRSTSSATLLELHILSILTNGQLLITMYASFSCTLISGYLSVSLQPHITVLNLPPLEEASFFIVSALVAAVCSPIPRFILYKGLNPNLILLTGSLLKGAALSFIGPLPWIARDPMTCTIVCGLVINGLGNCAVLMTSFHEITQIFQGPTEEDSADTAIFLNKISIILGNITGMLLGGIIMEYLSFRNGLTIFLYNSIVLCVVLLLKYLYIKIKTAFNKKDINEVSSTSVSLEGSINSASHTDLLTM